jgi:dihydroflavonol-4-reductase
MSSETVLVTGGSGFIASYCILELLRSGYRVRATVRSVLREPEVRALLRSAGKEPGQMLSFAVAELGSDAGWPEAVSGCTYVLHVASPLSAGVPKHEDELIIPARDGALRVLRAARDAGVRRVVLTSSFAAIGYGYPADHPTFTETDWTDLNAGGLSAYVKSKTLAERAAWDFIAKEGGALELAVVNPVVVLGPVLAADYSPSLDIVRRLLNGEMPLLPQLAFGIVDVRDVADLHLSAMTSPAASGQRLLAVAGDFMSVQQIAELLRRRLLEAARRVPTRVAPNWLMRLVSLFNPTIAQFSSELGKVKSASNRKAVELLGWSPRSNEEAIIAAAESLIRLRLLQRAPND